MLKSKDVVYLCDKHPSAGDYDLCAIAFNVAGICVSMFQPTPDISDRH